MFLRRPWLFSISISASFLLLTGFAVAQNISTAQLNGIVRDPQGAVIPNAAITITDTSRGFSRTTLSDSQGNYQLLLLPPGSYTVTASSPGFSKLIEQNVVLTTGQEAELPLALVIGGNESVTVTSGAEIIETQRSSQSTTVDQLRITNLPTNGRNYINFTLTNSQIARDAAPSVGAIPTSGLNFGGARARSNSINIDGADAGDYISGGTRSTVSQDAVQEFQIITNGFDAEYGRASGGVVNIVTKSGSNPTHAVPLASSATATFRLPIRSRPSTSRLTPAFRLASPSAAPSSATGPSTSSPQKSPAVRRLASPSLGATTSVSPLST